MSEAAFEAVARVKAEVDQLSESIYALEVAVKCGTKAAENEFLTLSELLMRQLLELDAIQAEGEARLQRKAEVCRVQSVVERLDSLKVLNSMSSSSSSSSSNAFPDRNGDASNSETGSTNAPPPMSSAVESIQGLGQCTYGTRESELQGTDEAEDLSTSEALFRRRGRRLDSGAQVQEGTERKTPSGVSELGDPSAPSQPDFHTSFSTPTGDFQSRIVDYPQIEVTPEISQFPDQMETLPFRILVNDMEVTPGSSHFPAETETLPFRILVNDMEVTPGLSHFPAETETLTFQTPSDTCFSFPRTQSIPVRASTSEDYLESDTYVNVGEILRRISPSPAITEASASVSANVAKNLSVLCELDDKATERLEIAFNKYPNLMNIRSDRRATFIRWMFSSLSNLLQLLSTASATSNLDAQKKSEIEVVLGELKTFGFDAGFIDEMRLQVSEAWEAQLAVNNAPSELKTLCEKAEDLNQEIASLESSLAAAKAEAAQVENRISTLCELVEVQANRSSMFKWIE